MQESPSAYNKAQEFFSQLTYRGQLFGCFLLCEHAERCVVVDMHAAHERINFNRIRARYRSVEQPVVAQLLFPVIVDLGREQALFFEEHSQLFERLGFEIEPFGDGIIAVRACPAFLSQATIPALMHEVSSGEHCEEAQRQYDVFLDRIWARMACHKSLRAGDELSAAEVYALLEQLAQTEDALVCPHGRPVTTVLERSQIEQWFARHSYGSNKAKSA